MSALSLLLLMSLLNVFFGSVMLFKVGGVRWEEAVLWTNVV